MANEAIRKMAYGRSESGFFVLRCNYYVRIIVATIEVDSIESMAAWIFEDEDEIAVMDEKARQSMVRYREVFQLKVAGISP
jgi:hypothetical protein